jgi:hypothetical protein
MRASTAVRLRAAVIVILSALLILPALAQTAPASERVYRVAVPLAEPEVELKQFRAMGLDLNTFDIKTEQAYLLVSESELDELERLGFQPQVLEDATPDRESTEALSDYLDEQESADAMERIANDYPSIAQRIEYSDPSREGRTITGLKISDNVGTEEAEPTILFVSQHHAREVMTPEVIVDFADELTQQYGIDEEVTRWVDENEIYLFPCHNPDGTDYVFNVNSNWRKNRRDNGDGSFGVDPNRNYPFQWNGCGGSSGTPSSNTYRGPSPGSEPITQGLIEITEDVRPAISLTYHTYGEYVLHPFGCDPALPDDPDRRAHRDIGSTLAMQVETDSGTGYYRMGTPPELLYGVDGDSDGWLHGIGGTVAFTIEMSSGSQGFQPDYDTWRDDTVERNLHGMRYLLRRLADGAVTGQVRDACTGDPLSAEVGVAEQTFTQGQEPRTSEPETGFFHRILIPGEYTWYGELDGYLRQDWPVEVGHAPVSRDLWLVPSGSHALEVRDFRVADGDGDADGQLDPGEQAELFVEAIATGEAVSGVTATLTSDDPYLVILDDTVTLPDMAAGAVAESQDAFLVEVLEDAPDGYDAEVTVTFTAAETLCRDTSEEVVRLTKGFPSCPFVSEPLDEDPLWTVTGPGGGWEYGDPQGSGGNGGPVDAHTGSAVYGTVLDGNYGSSAGEFVLETEPFDLQGLRDAELRFWRWLNNEPGYDPARVEVSVDQDSWTEVWSGFGRDTRWEEYRIDMPEFVDDAERVWVRFVLEQEGGGSRSGFYLDDVSFCGESFLSGGGKLKYESHRIVETDPVYGNADGELDAGETVTMPVTVRSTRSVETREVSAVLTTSTPGVEIHNAVALYPDVGAGDIAESDAPHFRFTAGPECGERISFELETRYEDGLSTTSFFTVPVGTLAPATLFSDDMETDRGWISDGDDAGAWERSDPRANFYKGEMTNPEDDHTPEPGVAAWHTQTVPPPTNVPATEAEVDGEVRLTSPMLEAGSFEDLTLTYWRWFFTGGGEGPDTLAVEVSTDDGLSWRQVDEVGVKANEWIFEEQDLDALVTLTDQLRIRFVATDGGGESIVEAGVDDLEMSGEEFVCESWDPPQLDPPNPVGNTLRVDKLRFDVELSWDEPATDPDHDQATFYLVDRSERVDGGFAQIGEPAAPFHVDVGAAGPSEPGFYSYLVTAKNNGGPEATP